MQQRFPVFIGLLIAYATFFTYAVPTVKQTLALALITLWGAYALFMQRAHSPQREWIMVFAVTVPVVFVHMFDIIGQILYVNYISIGLFAAGLIIAVFKPRKAILGEIVMWWALWGFIFGVEHGWLAIVGPLVATVLVLTQQKQPSYDGEQ